MVVPVPGGGAGRGGAAAEDQKPKIISELMKRGASGPPGGPSRCGRPAGKSAVDSPWSPDSAECGDRPRMCGVLHCARSEWSPRWEPRYVRVSHGSLEVYVAGEGGGARPRRRLPLRNLSLRRVPRRRHAFAICPREANASPVLLCQADDAESFSRWTRTLAVELMKQTPLGEVRFLDILRITEPPPHAAAAADEDAAEPPPRDPPRAPNERPADEVERLRELCQRGGATVHERRRLFEALGSAGGGREPRKQLPSGRVCASSEDLGRQAPPKSAPRSRAKRAKSLHDLPSDFPAPCAPEDGPPVSVVSQLRLFFEGIGGRGDGAGGVRDSECGVGRGPVGPVVRAHGTRGRPEKTGRSRSCTCEVTPNLVECCDDGGESDVFLDTNQELCSGKDSLRGGRDGKDLTSVSNVFRGNLGAPCKGNLKKDADINSYRNHDPSNGTHGDVTISSAMMTENIPLAAHLTVSNHSQPSSLSHSLSSESLTSSFLPSLPSPSSSCSSLSLNLSTPSSSPNSSQLSQHHYILSVIKKQAAEEEETIWSLQEEMARLDRERFAALSNKKKLTRKPRTPKRTYRELEAQLQQEELKLDKLYKEAERVLKIIGRSLKQETVNHC